MIKSCLLETLSDKNHFFTSLMKTVLSLLAIVAIGTMSYFQIIETQNKHSTRLQLMEADLEKNTEFRIKWPRGLMGSLPADSEQFMLI